MSGITRRKLIYGGAAAAASVGGLAVAERLARRYRLIPPDGAGVYGPGETLTYACQRLLTVQTPAREFPRSMISKNPFANAIAPPTDEFKRLEADEFRDWRLVLDGTVAHPLVLSLADLRSLPVHSQITEVACEEDGLILRSGSGRRSPLCCVRLESYRKRVTLCITPLKKACGRASTCRTPGIRIRCSQWG